MSQCKYCPVELIWAKTKNGKPMPLEQGRVAILDKHGQIHNGKLVHWGRCPGTEEAKKVKTCPQCQWSGYPTTEHCLNCGLKLKGA